MTYISTPENLEIVEALAKALRELPYNEILPRERLANMLKGKAHLLLKAKNVVERELGCIFVTVIRVGLKKLDPAQANLVGEKARLRARRGMSKAQTQVVGVVRTHEGIMAAQDKIKLTNELNKLGLAIEFCNN